MSNSSWPRNRNNIEGSQSLPIKNTGPGRAHCHLTAGEASLPLTLELQRTCSLKVLQGDLQTTSRVVFSYLAWRSISLGLHWFRRHFVNRNTEADSYIFFHLTHKPALCPLMLQVPRSTEAPGLQGPDNSLSPQLSARLGNVPSCKFLMNWAQFSQRLFSSPCVNGGLEEMEC